MSAWTDFRDAVEDKVGVGPNSTVNQQIQLAGGVVRSVGNTVPSLIRGNDNPNTSAPPAPVAQQVQQFVGNNKNALLMFAGLALVAFLIARRGR